MSGGNTVSFAHSHTFTLDEENRRHAKWWNSSDRSSKVFFPKWSASQVNLGWFSIPLKLGLILAS